MNARELTELAINVYGAMQKPDEFRQLMELCLKKKHETVLEIGSGRGGTLWAWSHLPNNRTVISVDMPGGDFGGGLMETDKERIENWMDKDKNTFLCSADSHLDSTYNEVYETLHKYGDGLVDILFIDGDHSYDGVRKDFVNYQRFVRKGGLIIFHDTCSHTETAPLCQVDKFWNEIKDMFDTESFHSEPLNWGGISVIKW